VLADTLDAHWETRNSWDEQRCLPRIHWSPGASLARIDHLPQPLLAEAELAVQFGQDGVGRLLEKARPNSQGWSDALTRYYRSRWELAVCAQHLRQENYDQARAFAFAVIGPQARPRALPVSVVPDWYTLAGRALVRIAWARQLATATEFLHQVLWCDSFAACQILDEYRFGARQRVPSRLLRLSFESLRQDKKFAPALAVAEIALQWAATLEDRDEICLWEQLREECREPRDFDPRDFVVLRSDDREAVWQRHSDGNWHPHEPQPAWQRTFYKEIEVYQELGFHRQVLLLCPLHAPSPQLRLHQALSQLALGQRRECWDSLQSITEPISTSQMLLWLELGLRAACQSDLVARMRQGWQQVCDLPVWTRKAGELLQRRRRQLDQEMAYEWPALDVSGPDRIVFQHPGLIHMQLTNSGLALTAGLDELCLWDVSRGQLLSRLEAGPPWAVSSDGLRLTAMTSGGKLGVWQLPNAQLLHVGAFSQVQQVYISSDGWRVAVCGGDGLQLWEPDRQRTFAPVAWSRGMKVHLHEDGCTVGLSQGRHLTWIDPARGLTLNDLEAPRSVLACAGNVAVVHDFSLWDWCAQTLLGKLDIPRRSSGRPLLSPDGRYLLMSCQDGSSDGALCLRLWQCQGATCLFAASYDYYESCCALSPSGRYIGCASQEGEVRIWDRIQRPRPVPFRGHTAMIKHLSVVRERGWLLSAGEDQQVRVWDLEQGHCLHQCQHTRDVLWVGLQPHHPEGLLFVDGEGAWFAWQPGEPPRATEAQAHLWVRDGQTQFRYPARQRLLEWWENGVFVQAWATPQRPGVATWLDSRRILVGLVSGEILFLEVDGCCGDF
jgi:WD40 repeat protein